MPYVLLQGRFVIRYPDIPRQGPEPDGDTVKFAPDTPALVEALPRPSGQPPAIGPRGVSVRLEAVDALETHFSGTHQALEGGNRARDALLAFLGFTNVVFYEDLPNKIESADQDTMPGWLLSNGVDANGRVIGFVFPGQAPAPEGSSVFLDEDGVDESANARLLADGLVYPAFYGTLPATLRLHLSRASRAARAAGSGIWPEASGDPDGPAQVTNSQTLATLTIWPKLFRRLVPYLAAGHTSLDGFDRWLREDPVHRDDRLLLLDPTEPGNLHDVVVAVGDTVQLTRWPEEFIIEPDPAPPGTGTDAGSPRAGDIAIVALLPDPTGSDAGRESVTLMNTTAADVVLDGWTLVGGPSWKEDLTGPLAAGDAVRVVLPGQPHLGNGGGAVTLMDPGGTVVDRMSYTAAQVRTGRTLISTC